jgi:hypothetical protein
MNSPRGIRNGLVGSLTTIEEGDETCFVLIPTACGFTVKDCFYYFKGCIMVMAKEVKRMH